MGEKPFRARQLFKWIYKRAVGDIDAMTDLGKDFRVALREIAEMRMPDILLSKMSADGTRKWLLRRGRPGNRDGVHSRAGRGTLCISSQVGCQMDCGFCATAQQGLSATSTPPRSSARCGSPTASSAIRPRRPRDHQRRVHGHGRAARQLPQRVPAADILMDDSARPLARRVTVSTSASCRR